MEGTRSERVARENEDNVKKKGKGDETAEDGAAETANVYTHFCAFEGGGFRGRRSQLRTICDAGVVDGCSTPFHHVPTAERIAFNENAPTGSLASTPLFLLVSSFLSIATLCPRS